MRGTLQFYALNGTDHADLCANGLTLFSLYLMDKEAQAALSTPTT